MNLWLVAAVRHWYTEQSIGQQLGSEAFGKTSSKIPNIGIKLACVDITTNATTQLLVSNSHADYCIRVGDG